MELKISPLWKERLLDLFRIAAILLCFYTIWLAVDGNTEKYNIPGIITTFQIFVILFVIILGEYNRSESYTVQELEAEKKRIINS